MMPAGCASCWVKAAAAGAAAPLSLRERDVVGLQRDRADALAGRGKVRVEHGRRGYEDRRLADAAPETAGWHEDRFDLRHLGDAHHIVAVEVLLLDAPVLDRTLAREERAEAIYERAGNLPLDLGRIDRISAIRGTHDAVDFDLIAARDRDLDRRRHVTAIAHLLGQAAIHALWCRLSPADVFRHGVQHGEMLGIFGHQLAAELEGILTGCMGDLVHEALEIDGILVVVDAAPESRRDVRVSRRVIA